MLRFARACQPHQVSKVHCRDGCPLDVYITSRYFQQSQSQGSELSQQRRRDRGPVFTPVGRDSPRVSSSHVRACPFLSTRHLVMKRPMKRKACVLVCLCVLWLADPFPDWSGPVGTPLFGAALFASYMLGFILPPTTGKDA